MKKVFFVVAVAAMLLTMGVACSAAVVMDQIGGGQFTYSNNVYASQEFGGDYACYDIAAIDDFSVGTSGLTVTQVQAVIGGWSGVYDIWSGIQGWRVEVYSSVDAAAANLTGDIGSALVGSGATVNADYFQSDFTNALVTLPVNIALGNQGTYYLGVMPILDFDTYGQVGVFDYAYGFPGGLDAYQVNPGGCFGFWDNQALIDPASNLAYRVEASPVPEPSSLLALGMGIVPFLAYRRRRG